MRVRIVDECTRSPCPVSRGVAVLLNRCREAIGAELQIIAYDKRKQPLATKTFWPASVANIPPGDYTFSLDHALQAEPGMHTFTLQVVSVKKWR